MIHASIIVPVYNAQESINQLHNSLINQSANGINYEIIYVNDGSKDNTRKILESYIPSDHITIINQKNQGPANARNNGVTYSRGDIILFTDSDCELQKNWLFEMIKPFHDPDIVGVQGCYKTRQNKIIALFDQFEIENNYKKMLRNKYIDSIGTYSAAYRKNIFLKAGGFNNSYKEASGEDFELSYYIHNCGHKMVVTDKAICFHKHPDNLMSFLKIKYRRGYWRALLHKKNTKKIINNLYTNNILKFQAILVSLFFISLLLLLFDFQLIIFPIFIVIFFFLLCIPFTFHYFCRSYKTAILSPILIFLRITAFFIGLSYGILTFHLLQSSKNNKTF